MYLLIKLISLILSASAHSAAATALQASGQLWLSSHFTLMGSKEGAPFNTTHKLILSQSSRHPSIDFKRNCNQKAYINPLQKPGSILTVQSIQKGNDVGLW